MHEDWAVLALDVVAASVLISAGLVKLVSPGQLVDALNELRRGPRLKAGNATVRAAAGLEIAVGCGLMAPALRLTAATGAAVVGLCFASLGIAGRLSSSTRPCGCAGGYGGRPLGLANVALGLALIAVLPANVLVDLRPEQSAAFAERAVVGTAIMLLVLALWTNRALALRLIRSPGSIRSPDLIRSPAGQNGTS